YSFSTETSVALIIAKTSSPSLSCIRFTEPVVIIDVISPAAVRMIISETTLSDTIFSTLPGKRFRMLVLMLDSFAQLAELGWSLRDRVHEMSISTDIDNKARYGNSHTTALDPKSVSFLSMPLWCRPR